MPRPTRAETPREVMAVRLSRSERERVDEAARANHQSRSQFLRDAVVTAAEECLETPERNTDR